jgi:hypothetical protein
MNGSDSDAITVLGWSSVGTFGLTLFAAFD